jgi:hypothetical protein
MSYPDHYLVSIQLIILVGKALKYFVADLFAGTLEERTSRFKTNSDVKMFRCISANKGLSTSKQRDAVVVYIYAVS